jgi:flagellin
MSKLASGKRINKAADDAAGLAISSNLSAGVRSLNQAKRNALDGVSMVQTAEGGLVESASILSRLRELSVQSASDTLGNQERKYLNQEYQAMKNELDRIASSTEFNGARLLLGTDESNRPEGLEGVPSNPMEIQIHKDYYSEADSLDASNPVNIIRLDMSQLGAYCSDLGLGKTGEDDATEIESKVGAQSSIGRLDTAITEVNSHRAYLGSIQNRLSSTINNIGVQAENIDQAKSRIVDADYAAETAEYTKFNILQQAGTSTLAQANAQPQIALSLLNSM